VQNVKSIDYIKIQRSDDCKKDINIYDLKLKKVDHEENIESTSFKITNIRRRRKNVESIDDLKIQMIEHATKGRVDSLKIIRIDDAEKIKEE